jgi:hypothetical protein
VVPQQGQEAVEEAAWIVTVMPVVTLACSTTTSERSGSIVIVLSLNQEKSSGEILFCSLFYHIVIIELAGEPRYAVFGKFFNAFSEIQEKCS